MLFIKNQQYILDFFPLGTKKSHFIVYLSGFWSIIGCKQQTNSNNLKTKHYEKVSSYNGSPRGNGNNKFCTVQ